MAATANTKKITIDPPIKRCASCLKVAKTRCSVCQTVYYCSRQCQVNDFPRHKAGCVSGEYEFINKYWPKGYPMFPRQVSVENTARGMFATSLIKAGQEVISEACPRYLPKGYNPKTLWKLYKRRMPELFQVMKKDPELDDKPHLQYCDIIKRNGYYVPTTEEWAWCWGVSFFRHHCEPNCHITPIVTQNPKDKYIMRVVALRPIMPNEELFIAYHETCTTGTYEYRRACLLETYGFVCDCSCCAGGKDSDNSKARDRLRDGFNTIREAMVGNFISARMPKHIAEAFEQLEKEIVPLIHDPHKYAINISLLNVRILRAEFLHNLGIVDTNLLDNVLAQIETLQTSGSGLYKRIKEFYNAK